MTARRQDAGPAARGAMERGGFYAEHSEPQAAYGELVDAGLLRASEYARMTIPTWNRTVAEYLEPFESGALDRVLALGRHEFRTLEDRYLAAHRRDDDLERYAADVAGFFRAAFEPSLWSALDGDRDAGLREQVAVEFHARLLAAIRADPEAAACGWHAMLMDIARPG